MSSYVAAAAAAASSPGVRNSVHLDSLDARIVQYHYALSKISQYVTSIRELRDNCVAKEAFPMMTYPMLLCGAILNVNDNIYKRSEILINGGKFNPQQQVDPPINTNSVNFDIMENATNYDSTKVVIPEAKRSFEALKLFENLILNAQQIYHRKLQQALQERSAYRVPDAQGNPQTFEWSEIKDLVEPVELSIVPTLIQQPMTGVKDAEAVREAMRDTDLTILQRSTDSVDLSLADIRETLSVMATCKTKEALLKAPHGNYMIHRGFAILLRLADLYAVLRRIGRRIYLFNYHYFQNFVRLHEGLKHSLAVVNTYFNQPKKNNVLLASVTKLTRQGAYVMVRSDSTLALCKQGREALALVTAMNDSLKTLAKKWVVINGKEFNLPNKAQLRDRLKVHTAELKRQSSMISPDGTTARRLEAMYIDPEKNKLEMERQSKMQKQREVAAKEERLVKEAEEREIASQRREMISLKAEEREKHLREELSRGSSPINTTTLSRRNSVLSSSSGSSRNGSLTRSASQRLSPVQTKTNLTRRHSVSLHPAPAEDLSPSSSSMRSLSPAHSSSESSTSSNGYIFGASPTSLRRTNPANINGDGAKSAVAGAASAFPKSNGSPAPKQPSLQARLAVASLQSAANQGKPLSAQQRLQRHILNSTMRGEMTTKTLPEKPRVSYTPTGRNPRTGSLQSNTKRYSQMGSPDSSRQSSLLSDRSPKNSLTSDVRRSRSSSIQSQQNSIQEETAISSPSPIKASPLIQRVRSNSASQRPAINITKIDEDGRVLSVREGGHVPNNSSPGSSILVRSRAGSRASSVRTAEPLAEPAAEDTTLIETLVTPVKKVRFAGVPEYTEAEDAPSPKKKMWAKAPPVFRFAAPKQVDNTRKKERMFTAQEGLAFRKNTHSDEWGGFARNKELQVAPNGKVSMMSLVDTPQQSVTSTVPKGKLTQLFKRR